MIGNRWIGPRGELITFQDVRPGKLAEAEAKAVAPIDVPTVVEVAGEEARHASVGGLFGFKITSASADVPEPGAWGHVAFVGKGLTTSCLPTA